MMFSAAASQKSPAASRSTSGETVDDARDWPPELRRLKRDDPTLTSLRVLGTDRPRANLGKKSRKGCYHARKPEDWQRLGEAIASNTNLRRLDLLHMPYSGAEGFCASLDKNRSIARLVLHDIDPCGGELFASHLSQFLRNNSSLTSLSVTRSYLGPEGAESLSSALAGKTSSLKYLDISGAGMDEVACQELIQALRHEHFKLRSLELNQNSIWRDGCAFVAALLRDPRCMLVRIYLDDNCINDEGAAALAYGLAGNKSLKTLSIRGNRAITSRGYQTFSAALCNAPGIDDILLSNHTIERIGADCGKLPVELESSLRFNRAKNTRRAANRKVVMYHFVRNCNLHLFGTVPGGLVPSILAMIADHTIRSNPGKNDRTDADAKNHLRFAKNDYRTRHSALHRIVRRCPSACERHSFL